MKAIYALVDPTDGRVRYVGASANPERRLRQHLRQARIGSAPRDIWLRGLAEAGATPTMCLLTSHIPTWEAAECAWILHYRLTDPDLTNLAAGGRCVDHTPEVRAKISAAQRGVPERQPMPPEQRAKISATLRGKPKTAEHRANIGASKLGFKMPREAVERVRRANLGRKHTPEARERMGASKRGLPSPMLGRKHTAETRAKMSAAHLRRAAELRRAA